jgi:GNAT superfamily N-acetyltransferase
MFDAVMRRLARHAGLRWFRFFERSLEPGVAQGVERSALQMRFVPPGEIGALWRDRELEVREEMARAASDRGDLCVAAYDGPLIAGYCWHAFAPLPHLDGVWVRFARHVAWPYKSFVRPAYRGRGIAQRLYRFADAAGVERGRITSVICVEAHNAPSVAAALRAGYRGVGAAGYLRRGSLFRDWYSAPVRRLGVSFYL